MELKNDEYGSKKIYGFLMKDVKNKEKVQEIIGKYPNNLSVCNADLILSLKHLLIAINRGIYNYTYYTMKTEKLSTEIIYHLAPQNAVFYSVLIIKIIDKRSNRYVWTYEF